MTVVIVGLLCLVVGFVLGGGLLAVLMGGHDEDRAQQGTHRDGGVTDLAESVGVLIDEPAPREAL